MRIVVEVGDEVGCNAHHDERADPVQNMVGSDERAVHLVRPRSRRAVVGVCGSATSHFYYACDVVGKRRRRNCRSLKRLGMFALRSVLLFLGLRVQEVLQLPQLICEPLSSDVLPSSLSNLRMSYKQRCCNQPDWLFPSQLP
jgi:hypothetical protein